MGLVFFAENTLPKMTFSTFQTSGWSPSEISQTKIVPHYLWDVHEQLSLRRNFIYLPGKKIWRKEWKRCMFFVHIVVPVRGINFPLQWKLFIYIPSRQVRPFQRVKSPIFWGYIFGDSQHSHCDHVRLYLFIK